MLTAASDGVAALAQPMIKSDATIAKIDNNFFIVVWFKVNK